MIFFRFLLNDLRTSPPLSIRNALLFIKIKAEKLAEATVKAPCQKGAYPRQQNLSHQKEVY